MNLKLKINSRGEIATILTLISVGLMLAGIVVGNVAVKQTTRTQSKAGDGSKCSDYDGRQNDCELSTQPKCSFMETGVSGVQCKKCVPPGTLPQDVCPSQNSNPPQNQIACNAPNYCLTDGDDCTGKMLGNCADDTSGKTGYCCKPGCSNFFCENGNKLSGYGKASGVIFYPSDNCTGTSMNNGESLSYCKKSAPPPAATTAPATTTIPATQNVKISGTIRLNGNTGDHILIEGGLSTVNTLQFIIQDNVPAQDGATWSWNEAESGKNYTIRALLFQSNGAQTDSLNIDVVAPKDGNVISFNSPSANQNCLDIPCTELGKNIIDLNAADIALLDPNKKIGIDNTRSKWVISCDSNTPVTYPVEYCKKSQNLSICNSSKNAVCRENSLCDFASDSYDPSNNDKCQSGFICCVRQTTGINAGDSRLDPNLTPAATVDNHRPLCWDACNMHQGLYQVDDNQCGSPTCSSQGKQCCQLARNPCDYSLTSVDIKDGICTVEVDADGIEGDIFIGCQAYPGNYCTYKNNSDDKTFRFDCADKNPPNARAFKEGGCQSVGPNAYIFKDTPKEFTTPTPSDDPFAVKHITNYCTGFNKDCLPQGKGGKSAGINYCCEYCDPRAKDQSAKGACLADPKTGRTTDTLPGGGKCSNNSGAAFPVKCLPDTEENNILKWINMNGSGECNSMCYVPVGMSPFPSPPNYGVAPSPTPQPICMTQNSGWCLNACPDASKIKTGTDLGCGTSAICCSLSPTPKPTSTPAPTAPPGTPGGKVSATCNLQIGKYNPGKEDKCYNCIAGKEEYIKDGSIRQNDNSSSPAITDRTKCPNPVVAKYWCTGAKPGDNSEGAPTPAAYKNSTSSDINQSAYDCKTKWMDTGKACASACATTATGATTPNRTEKRPVASGCDLAGRSQSLPNLCSDCIVTGITDKIDDLGNSSCEKYDRINEWCATHQEACLRLTQSDRCTTKTDANPNLACKDYIGKNTSVLPFSYSNEGFDSFIAGVKKGIYNALDASLYVLNASRVPGLQRLYCDPFQGQCDFGV